MSLLDNIDYNISLKDYEPDIIRLSEDGMLEDCDAQ